MESDLIARGRVLYDQGQWLEAEFVYRQLFAITPSDTLILSKLIHIMQRLARWEGLSQLLSQLRQDIGNGPVSPFAALAFPDVTPWEQQQFARHFFKFLLPEAPAKKTIFSPPQRRRIRLGYLSNRFSTTPTGLLMAQVLELHDRDRFEVFVYSYGAEEKSRIRARLKMAPEHFINLHSYSFAAMAKRILQDGIDILVNLNGYNSHGPTPILSYTSASIHVNWLGFPGTLGTALVDYIVADHWVIPEGYQQFYDEKVVRLPNTYQANDRKRVVGEIPSRQEAGLPQDGIIFCNLNQVYKITPDIFDNWMALLKSVPNSYLWLLDDNPWASEQLKTNAASRGCDPGRLIFAPKIPVARHLARLSLADLYLDTFPCNGHTTASECLWVGVPVVTCSGKTFASRVAGSLVRAIDCPELVTTNLNEYFQLALNLATQPLALSALRQKIQKNRLTTPLFDCEGFTRNLEQAYDIMWERHQHGELPADISI